MTPPPQRKQLTDAERGQIIGMWKCDKSFAAIGRDLGINCDTVRKVCNYYATTGKIIPPPRPGRPTILTDRDRRVIKRYVKSGREERRTALSDITAKCNIKVSEDTLLHELQKLNLNHRIERKKPYLRPAQKEARLAFAEKYGSWGFEEWSRVIFTDEMAMQTGSNDGKVYVWRSPEEEYLEDCVAPTHIPGFKRVKIWGGIRHGKLSKLVIINEDIEKGRKMDAEFYLKEIMDKEMFNFWMEAMEDCGHVFVMEDGAPCHMGVASMRRKQLMEDGWEGWGPGTWPSNSPDLNPIENVWRMLKCAVRKRQPPPRTEKELADALLEEWEKLDMDKINGIILTMPNRLAEVKQVKGGSIPY